jgi:hypothetical protein
MTTQINFHNITGNKWLLERTHSIFKNSRKKEKIEVSFKFPGKQKIVGMTRMLLSPISKSHHATMQTEGLRQKYILQV